MPELANVGQVNQIYPIPGADFIESLEVGESFNLSNDEALGRYAERTCPNDATAEGVVIRPTQENAPQCLPHPGRPACDAAIKVIVCPCPHPPLLSGS